MFLEIQFCMFAIFSFLLYGVYFELHVQVKAKTVLVHVKSFTVLSGADFFILFFYINIHVGR